MASALTLLLIGCLLQGALCVSQVIMPQTMEVLRGSCVTIPCSFDVDDQLQRYLNETCRAVWKNDKRTVVFDSSSPQSRAIKGNLIGDLKRKDCTTTLNNIQQDKYSFRVECDNKLKHTFVHPKVNISVNDNPPRPTLTPSTLTMKEGSSVSLTCSAPAPCPSHPPALTWTPSLGVSQETMQEKQDKTKVMTTVLTFTASHLHHGQEITCTAVYSKEDGTTESSVSSLTADILFAPKILSSFDCTKTADQLNCSCQTVGNPSPTLQWYLDGLPVNQSDKFTISKESLNDTGLKSILTVTQPQWKDLSTLLCQSSNYLGSASQRFYVYSLEPQTEVHGPGVLLLAVAGVSLSVNVLYTVCVVVLCKARKSVKPKEEDQTYMSLDRRDTSPEYDVIGQTPK